MSKFELASILNCVQNWTLENSCLFVDSSLFCFVILMSSLILFPCKTYFKEVYFRFKILVILFETQVMDSRSTEGFANENNKVQSLDSLMVHLMVFKPNFKVFKILAI